MFMIRKILFVPILLLFISCSITEPICSDCPSKNTTSGNSTSSSSSSSCGSGRTLYKGPEGGCYYINSNGNKTYVDRSCCN